MRQIPAPCTAPASRLGACLLAIALTLIVHLAGCAGDAQRPEPPTRPADLRAQIANLLPSYVNDRSGWASDIHGTFTALGLPPSAENLCAVIAVTEQESSFRADPAVPNLNRIAWEEIDRRAAKIGVPAFAVRAALKIQSPNGKTYAERIDSVKTERELSEIFEDFIDMVPMGKRLFADKNPVRTGGAMQVSIAFAEQHAQARPYPTPLKDGSIRHEVFTRRGGLYFGTAHLLAYPANYDKPIYRFADFNAGQYASRNAAFQRALSLVSGKPLDLDGDLIAQSNTDLDKPGSTELALRSLGKPLNMDKPAIRRALEQSRNPSFDNTALYQRVFELADRAVAQPLPRARIPQIVLHSPKFTRKLTTEWFAQRVDERHQRCLVRASALNGNTANQ